ncbi:Tex family protein [Pseudosulfitobacter pseudonitzschiae]|uniref:Tex family protein n=1 Tax=Pseudosulfitobacter pseudonitzschiae TaxID=1402135 RepID=UPI001AF7FA02|nr:Tex family protein [Pseudosulfitobacter pseudonitzschiae]MBM1814856.1 RNA-binding transcriptional accessory protein [Pseudosulfitobacter pseudonitzschiae]MBM1831850.1 RNA-binding transcriptional accessory protein [Pseudosulfitobacter pseudonitzschiae]MBM1836715.1 RNA-binding transcriptional accessory protein [Pseudosulfitobacter pseudonitzschiae]MBM1841562.1 RNA-binding transcriptional accessory protein [Pseudosulfitobacter pseudonitzschiae]MBM1846429.1 RNA-binding transcriptional accessory
MTDVADRIARTIAADIDARPEQVTATVALLDGGDTVPFVARYRKEVTGGLDDTQLRRLAERLEYLRDLEKRRASILSEITSQGKLTDALARDIAKADTKAVLEDLYLPYKPKRRTKAMIARENGLEPLLRAILADRTAEPAVLAKGYLSEAVETEKDALTGARDILAEELGENAALLGRLRQLMQSEALITAKVNKGKEEVGAKFSDYFDHSEKWAAIPSHRALAILRAAKEDIVSVDIAPDPDTGLPRVIGIIASEIGIPDNGPGDIWLREAAAWTWRIKLSGTMFMDLLAELRRRAHGTAIEVFARNLKDLLLAAPAGARATLGLDPGIRTGCKIAVVDQTGKLIDTATIYPFQPKNDLRGAEETLLHLIRKHAVALIAIGNGTASRESEKLVGDVLKRLPAGTARPTPVIVSEAGASVYSASELAAQEFPDVDVSIRGAVSIARRLQDPLAELVKIEPQAIGVGQYQHDVDQRQLAQSLAAVVEDAVNAVGVDLNMASAPLLSHIAGLGPSLAQNIVTHRDSNGAFKSRKALLKVAGLGPKAFQQCAGFLRIPNGDEPLDASSVHPEAYGVARKIVQACGRDVRAIMGDSSALSGLRAEQFVDDSFGLPTVRDILSELEKPGRDPRPAFKTATFAEGIDSITDLKPGMSLEGTVTNVAAFGAFVDIGVHQDGLVHVSQLADRFVKDPYEVVKAGDVVRVRVTEVDVPRKRIGLTMRKDGGDRSAPRAAPADKPKPRGKAPMSAAPKAESQGAFGSALADAFKRQGPK